MSELVAHLNAQGGSGRVCSAGDPGRTESARLARPHMSSELKARIRAEAAKVVAGEAADMIASHVGDLLLPD